MVFTFDIYIYIHLFIYIFYSYISICKEKKTNIYIYVLFKDTNRCIFVCNPFQMHMYMYESRDKHGGDEVRTYAYLHICRVASSWGW